MIKNCSNCAHCIFYNCSQKNNYYCDAHTLPYQYGNQPLVYIVSDKQESIREALMSRVIPIVINNISTEKAEQMIIDNTRREAMLKSDAIWVFNDVTNDMYYDIETAKQKGVPVYYINEQKSFPKNTLVFNILQTAYQIGQNEDSINIYEKNNILFFQNEWNKVEQDDAIAYDTAGITDEEKSYLNKQLEKLPFSVHVTIL